MAICNHIGQVVADLDRSARFYQDVLGFQFWYDFSPPDEGTAKLCSLQAPLGVKARYLFVEGVVLELIHYAEPGVTAPYQPRTMNQPGLTHLSFAVEDVQGTAQKAVEYGGQIIEDSDIGFGLFIRDPDGQLVELLNAGFRQMLPPRP